MNAPSALARRAAPEARGATAVSLRCALMSVMLTTWACEGGEALTATAQLEVSPESLEFGAVTFGDVRTLELRLTNPAQLGTLRIESAEFEEGSAGAFSLVGVPPDQIGPGETVVLGIRYTPDDAEADAGALVLRTNAAERPIRRVAIGSERTIARLRVDPERVELGSILSGGRAERAFTLASIGDAPVTLARVALRTGGFLGEPCASDAQCRDDRCRMTRHGSICTLPCGEGCPEGSTCEPLEDQSAACVAERSPALAGRGFEITGLDPSALPSISPGERLPLLAVYAPGPEDRGSAQVIIESDDESRPVLIVPLLGRPEDLPPTAVAERLPPVEDPLLPGSEVLLSGEASSDPEGGALTYAWRFLRRPQGSRAAFTDPSAGRSAFTVDLPGTYTATLEVVDESGQSSSNDARVDVSAEAGPGFEVELTWNRPETDLDIHVVPPGASIGSVADCFFDNPVPDWAPPGPDGDPSFSSGPSRESVIASAPPEGVYSVATRVVAPSPQGPTSATVRVSFSGVEVARYTAVLAPDAEAWDVATISWPNGRIAYLGTIR